MDDHLLNVYNRIPINFVKGEGCYLYDADGNKYLDAFSGIAVTGLGHNHPAITKAIAEQAQSLLHISNLVEIPEQSSLSDLLVEKFADDARVFFSNSGAEAIETAVKLTRLYGHSKNIENPKVVVMSKGFHGRTNAAIAAGGSDKVKKGFEPLLPGFLVVEYNNTQALMNAVSEDKDIIAVLLEPLQGEGGINVPSPDYLAEVRAICDQNGLLMIVDEIQAGIGRTGKFFCYEHSGIIPDAITLAKGLANGLPIGATIIRAPHHELFKPGSHGSTFGGNPLSCRVASATINEIFSGNLLENATKQGEAIINGLRTVLKSNKHIVDIRGKGMMMGIEFDKEVRPMLPILLKHKMITNPSGTHVLRLLPPLIYTDEETQLLLDTLPKVIDEYFA